MSGPAAHKLKQLRERTSLSIGALASRVGLQKSSYQYYEDSYKKSLLPQELTQTLVAVFAEFDIAEAEVLALGGLMGPDQPTTVRAGGLRDASQPAPSRPVGKADPSAMDTGLFRQIITATDRYLEGRDITVAADKKADLYFALYDIIARDGVGPDDEIDITEYDNVIRLAV